MIAPGPSKNSPPLPLNALAAVSVPSANRKVNLSPAVLAGGGSERPPAQDRDERIGEAKQRDTGLRW
ncbi:MAG: hypothetical protein RQ833_01010 [Sphingomonadaceae bacterium]|nr:hypothetical protein [Sphingomonadaceae bacterium]